MPRFEAVGTDPGWITPELLNAWRDVEKSEDAAVLARKNLYDDTSVPRQFVRGGVDGNKGVPLVAVVGPSRASAGLAPSACVELPKLFARCGKFGRFVRGFRHAAGA